MRALRYLLPLVLAAVSCQKPLFPDTPRYARMQDRFAHMPKDSSGGGATPLPGPDSASVKPSVYVTALRFPEGALWQQGALEGARIVLWKDGKEVLDIPAGHYAEPDRHRVRGGHLWSEDSDGARTQVYRDGELQVEYEGDEILRGLLVLDGALHTIGQRAGGGGFSYRINGEAVFSHPSATVLGSFEDQEWEGGALMQEGGNVYYSYAVPVRKTDGYSWEYHVMQGDQPFRKIPEGSAETVFDIRIKGGSVYRSEQRGAGGQSLALVRDDKILSLDVPSGETVHLCKLVPHGEEMLVKGYSTRMENHLYTSWLRGKNGLVQALESPFLAADMYADNPGKAVIFLSEGRVRSIWNGEKDISVTVGRYSLFTKGCSTLKDGTLYAALTDLNFQSHLVLQGEELLPFSFNGCFTSVRIE